MTMDVLNSGEPEPSRDIAQTQTWPEDTSAYDGDLAAFETFELPGEGELDVEDAFGEHDIEYWVWDGNRLIPAPPDKLARIREIEALDRLTWRNQLEARLRQAHETPARWESGLPFAAVWHRVVALAGRLRRQANGDEQSYRHPEHQSPSRKDGAAGSRLEVWPQHHEERTEHR